ncbi:permease prefix domain 1-containing protein [Microbacterium sp.]|uniref:permease prefix domain 1-containing protein n=1 Tax=Microbacterium sp. TaxID=51671 RepID=UPI00281239E2|nr:permease prefix domain 1-containing protein [Microbacterium sp.]
MTATLTERYISATIRSLRPDVQADVRAELQASIDDAVEARLEQGESREQAERAVLTELGDPGILAAGYADRPLHLIGPRYFLTWWRLLRLLLIVVPACAMLGVAIAEVLGDATVGEVFASVIAMGLSVIVHVSFWTTLVFAVLERTGTDTGVKWDVDQLPEQQDDGAGRSELIGSLVFLAIAVGAILWDRFRGFVQEDARALPILNPELWPWGIAGLFALIVLEAALAVAVYAARRWTTTLAIVNSALAVLFVSWALTLLGRGELVNPAFVDSLVGSGAVQSAEPSGQGGVLAVLAAITGVAIVAFAVWDVVDGWRKARRAAEQPAGRQAMAN